MKGKLIRIENTHPNNWWHGIEFIEQRIGESEEFYYLTPHQEDGMAVKKSDCTVLQSDRQPGINYYTALLMPVGEPEQWVHKVGDLVCSDTPNCYKDELKGLCGKLLEVQSTPQMYYKIEVDMSIHPNYKGSEALNGKGSVWCYSIYNPLPHEIPQPEPKLIAKAGEENLYYPGIDYQELFDLLYEQHGLNLLSSQMDDIIRIAIKMQKSEPVQVDTPIERIEKPIDKVTIERLDFVLRMCNIQLHSALIDKIIDCVELIEEKGEETSLMDVCKMQAEWKRL